ncbi:MAG: DNA mismatch endonuclease Vsr [Gammaproteobacteria bacterium]|nr:DNA mismatch endonuclease Vsr [Gammaproteobacteria bacterium]
MTDVVDAATRSRMMSGIRGANTKPERYVRSLLHRRGFRFRLHARDLPGRPDIVLPRYRAVLLVHGCFWHGHDCPLFRLPATRRDFWGAKIERNRANDRKAATALRATGWRVGTVWECAMRGPGALNEMTLTRTLARWLLGDTPTIEIRGPRVTA